MTETLRPTRDELLRLLGETAALEHSLTCQYLFAAFSLKRVGDPGLTDAQTTKIGGWVRILMMVARQEMEHLGLVANLLTAVGGSPWFGHPGFPYGTPLFGHRMALEPFSIPTLQKFVCFERPDEIEPEDAFCGAAPDPGRKRQRALRAHPRAADGARLSPAVRRARRVGGHRHAARTGLPAPRRHGRRVRRLPLDRLRSAERAGCRGPDHGAGRGGAGRHGALALPALPRRPARGGDDAAAAAGP